MEFILPLRSYWLIKGHSNRASSAAHVASSPPTTAIRRGRREASVGMHRQCAVRGLRPTVRRHVTFSASSAGGPDVALSVSARARCSPSRLALRARRSSFDRVEIGQPLKESLL